MAGWRCGREQKKEGVREFRFPNVWLLQRTWRWIEFLVAQYVSDAHTDIFATDAGVPWADGQVVTLHVVFFGLEYHAPVVVEVCSGELLQIPIPVAVVVEVGGSNRNPIELR